MNSNYELSDIKITISFKNILQLFIQETFFFISEDFKMIERFVQN